MRDGTLARTMRNSQSVVALLLGIVLGCAAERVLVVPPAHAGTTPQRWEYACRNASGEKEPTDTANQFGQQGWELVGAAPQTLWGYVVFQAPAPVTLRISTLTGGGKPAPKLGAGLRSQRGGYLPVARPVWTSRGASMPLLTFERTRTL
jgi:hypothetical protein